MTEQINHAEEARRMRRDMKVVFAIGIMTGATCWHVVQIGLGL